MSTHTPVPDRIDHDAWEGYDHLLRNDDFYVGDRVNYLAQRAETIRIGVGYFYIGGFDLIREALQSASSVQLLIGKQTSERTVEEIRRGFTDHLNKYEKEDASEGVTRLYDLIRDDRVEVRVYDKQTFHPKVYTFKSTSADSEYSRAIVSSANASRGGFQTNVELATEVCDRSQVETINAWFDEWWEEAEPFDPALMETQIENSQFESVLPDETKQEPLSEVDFISPVDAAKVFIATVFEEEVEHESFLDRGEEAYTEKLTAFQEDAFDVAKHPLEKYGGVILADSVGLGKSYIGAPLVQKYVNQFDRVLVISPRRLRAMWMGELLGDDGEFPVPAEVSFVSFNALSRLTPEAIQDLRNVDFVVVDEAHNLRNLGTKRYEKIRSIGRLGKKFVLLSATPVQNSVHDVENIINIFAEDSDFDLAIDNHSPSAVFKDYAKLSKKYELTGDEQDRLSHREEQVNEVLKEVMISRDREYIVSNYDDEMIGDQEITIPERKPQVVTADDPRQDELYNDIVEVVLGESGVSTGLNMPYVGLDRYEEGTTGDEDPQHQNKTVLIFIRLLKRLESSFAAFNESIQRLILREQIVRDLAAGNPVGSEEREVAVEDVEAQFRPDIDLNLDVEELDETVQELGEGARNTIVEDANEDLGALQDLRSRVQGILDSDPSNSEVTPKHEKLRTILEGKTHEKVLIFSEYLPTIKHLFEELTGTVADSAQVGTMETITGDRSVAYVHGGKAFDEQLVERFAPDAKNADVDPDEEIDVLITSDVLCAGHNLQDARVLVNYDLRWNPMQLEQRIGRIDRITTDHDELHIYNFVPTGEIEERLGIMRTIEGKIEDIARTVGKSSPILKSAETQISKSVTAYEQLDDAGMFTTDDEITQTVSQYEDLRNSALQFCEEYGVGDIELQQTVTETQCRTKTQYVQLSELASDETLILANLRFSSGREEFYPVIFGESGFERVHWNGQAAFTDYPREETNPVEIFDMLARGTSDRDALSTTVQQETESFVEDLRQPDVWNSKILGTLDESWSVEKVRGLCSDVIEKDSASVDEEAEEVRNILAEFDIGSWAKKEIGTMYRNRYEYEGLLEEATKEIHTLLTEDAELVPSQTVEEATILVAGRSGR